MGLSLSRGRHAILVVLCIPFFCSTRADGIAAFPGTAGDYNWAGYAGTYFWVDPAQDLVAVLMTQAPSPARAGYRRLLRQLVYQAIVD
jgi:CubicO group peptidase (beta-lactamase class C family)